MPRIFLPYSELQNKIITISGEKAKYISSVLRCVSGDLINITDDQGNSYYAVIITSTKKEIKAEITGKQIIDTESPIYITLLQGLLKGEKMDFVIQKSIELGVNRIIPVITERSQIRETKKLLRWKKIAEEASRQSGRSIIPEIVQTLKFEDIFTGSNYVSRTGIIFWEQGNGNLSEILNRLGTADKLSLFTGPEGGFSEKEVEIASENGFVVASLGKRILRAETAAIAAVSIIQYRLGDVG
ncbi:MAG: hypothetical protein A2X59_13365 [Nitrospirae bacterium GWC2_42_7]|nr:MAG: hypothetical protein A2X59_13365 [Nitrospirae bacterium GWC2_42_7]